MFIFLAFFVKKCDRIKMLTASRILRSCDVTFFFLSAGPFEEQSRGANASVSIITTFRRRKPLNEQREEKESSAATEKNNRYKHDMTNLRFGATASLASPPRSYLFKTSPGWKAVLDAGFVYPRFISERGLASCQWVQARDKSQGSDVCDVVSERAYDGTCQETDRKTWHLSLSHFQRYWRGFKGGT
jgi:hypothetical protein